MQVLAPRKSAVLLRIESILQIWGVVGVWEWVA
jgi:hypothetical protein